MIAVDTNILVYAHRRDSEWHEKAYRLIQSLAEGSAPWAIPWPCLHEFLAVVTHRGGEWRIQAAENVTLTDPMTGVAHLRP